MWSLLQPHEGAHEPAVLRIELLSLPVFLVAWLPTGPRRGCPAAAGYDWLLLISFLVHCSQDPSELSLFKLVASPCAAPVLLSVFAFVFCFFQTEAGTCPLMRGGRGVSKRRAGVPVPSPAVSMALHPHPKAAEHPGLFGRIND